MEQSFNVNLEEHLTKRINETADWLNHSVRARYLALAPQCDPQSPPEKVLLIEMLIGLPEEITILPQKDIAGLGFPCRVDFLLILPYTKKNLVIECDGERHQKDSYTIKNDKKRDRKLLLAGIPVLRFATEEILYRSAEVIQEIRRAINEFDR